MAQAIESWINSIVDWQSIPVILGAFAGAGVSVLVSEVIKSQVDRRSKRDASRLERLTDAALVVSRNARTMLHLVGSGRSGRPVDVTALGEAHEAVRIGVDQLQMNAGPGLQKVALLVRRHAHALRVVGGGGDDPRPEYGLSVYTRTEQAIEYMLDHVRAELRVAGGVVQTPDDEEYEELVKEVVRARARVK